MQVMQLMAQHPGVQAQLRQIQEQQREHVERVLEAQAEHQLKMVRIALKSDDARLRYAAAVAAGPMEDLSLHELLIPLLEDGSPSINQAARQSLKQLSLVKKKQVQEDRKTKIKGEDFGPPSYSTASERKKAARKWREWWKD